MVDIITYGTFDSGRIGLLDRPVADIEVGGSDGGTFQVQSPTRIQAGSWVSVPGTCFGGIVDTVSTSSETRDITYKGRCWPGMLTDRIITPPSGQANLTVAGDLTDVIGTLMSNAGFTPTPFALDATKSGVTVKSTSIDRYCTLADALTKVLQAAGTGRYWITENGGTVTLHTSAASTPILVCGVDEGVTLTYAATPIPVNHLIGLGKGEGTAREIVHRYADTTGAVSAKQTITGVHERQQTYELSDKSGAELTASVEQKLKELQTFGTATITYTGSAGLLLPYDRLTVIDPHNGVKATATITKTVYKLDNTGKTAVSWTAETA